MDVLTYLNDGSHPQARGVLCALQCAIGDGIESSWNEQQSQYDAEIQVDRWHNCREQGHIAALRFFADGGLHQLNIAWFEHRNSDAVHAVKWEQVSTNPITIDSAKFGEVYATKYETSYSVGYGNWVAMGDWIKEQFTAYWDLHHPKASS